MSDTPLRPDGPDAPPALSVDPSAPSLNEPPRMPSRRPLWLFLAAFAVIVILALVLIVYFAPKPTPPKCPDPSEPCEAGSLTLLQKTSSGLRSVSGAITLPPPVQTGSPPLRNGATWTDAGTGVQVDWDDTIWTESSGLPAGLEVLSTGGGNIVVRIEAYSASDVSADVLAAAMRDFAGSLLEGIAPNTEDRNRPLRPQIGYVDAVGGYYTGFATEGGQIIDFGITILAASDGRSTVGYMVFTPGPDGHLGDDTGPRLVKAVGQLVDVMLNHTFWTAPQP